MRILLTCDPLIPVPPVGYGGIERIVDGLIRFHRAAGHTVALLAHAASTAPVEARFTWTDTRIAGAGATLRNALALRRAVRVFDPDVVHSFSRLGYLLPTLATRQPVVMSYQRHTGGRQLALAAWLGGASLRFTGCSEFICAQGRKHGGDWRAIPNFVDCARFTFSARVPDDAPLVFLGRIEAIKGPRLAIAIARAARRPLVLAGNAPSDPGARSFWKEQIAPHLGRDGVEWIGEVDDAAKNELLGRAAALVSPVQWDEPFGIVFAEALACGTPVISCPRGALPEIVRPGVNGFLVTDSAEGAAAVARLAQISRADCRRDAEARFDQSVVAARYEELYRSFSVSG